MLPNKSPVRFVLLAVGCALLAGCSENNVVPVSGTLTFRGKPVTNAIIHFVPEKGRPSMGETDAQGKFTLTYDPQKKGAERGKHKVFVMRNSLADQSRPGVIPGMPIAVSAEEKEFFEKYDSSNSTVEVIIDKKTEDLKLTWD